MNPIQNIGEANFGIVTYMVVLLVICIISNFVVRKNEIVPDFFIQQKWNVIEGAIVLILGQVAVFLLKSAALFFQDAPFVFTAINLFYGPMMLTAIWLFFQFRLRQPLAVLGISKGQWRGDIFWGSKWIFILYLMAFLFLYILPDQRLSGMYDRILTEQEGSVKALEVYVSFWGLPIAIFLLLSTLLFSNAIEEILFRGIFYSSLRKKFNMLGANFMSSALFMLSHGRVSLGIFAFGCFFGYLYERSKSLVPSIAAHIIANLLFYVFIGVISRTNINSRTFLNLGTSVLSICVVVTWLLSTKKNLVGEKE